MINSDFTWIFWWHGSDWILRGVFVVLILASVTSWAVILFKTWQFFTIHRLERVVNRQLVTGIQLAELAGGLSSHLPSNPMLEVVATRTLWQGRHMLEINLNRAISEQRILLENGLTFLATIGGSAPFIGLFGTVWGIMHALQNLGGSQAISMDLVAGPVAEALVATAVGLFAAIPAVMGYNMLLRQQRRLFSTVEANGVHIINRLLTEQPHLQKGR